MERSRRELRDTEDQASRAGARNTFEVVQGHWPQLVKVMAPVRELLVAKNRKHKTFQNLVDACGSSPTREEPSTEVLTSLRCQVGALLGLSSAEADLHHPASPIRYRLVQEVIRRSGDPDVFVGQWLEHGAPVGIRVPIDRGDCCHP